MCTVSPQLFVNLQAAGSSDGYVRVYEAPDVMNLQHWEFTVGRGGRPRREISLSSPPSRAWSHYTGAASLHGCRTPLTRACRP